MKTQHAFRKEKGMIVKWDFQWSCPDFLFPVKCNQYGDTVSRGFKVYEITKAEKKRKKQNKTNSNEIGHLSRAPETACMCLKSVCSLSPGVDEKEHATPILSLCHGIFTDWSIFSKPFLLRRKDSSGPVTQWRQISFLWLVMAFQGN